MISQKAIVSTVSTMSIVDGELNSDGTPASRTEEYCQEFLVDNTAAALLSRRVAVATAR
jgi:hypothetical protein